MKNAENWLLIKVVVMILALVGIFWAKSALQGNASSLNADPAAPIPAKVHFGK